MNVVDSSAWIAYFTATKNATHFVTAAEDMSRLIVPSIVMHEVFKALIRSVDDGIAFALIGHMKKGNIVDLNMDIALEAVRLSQEKNLATIESITLATAHHHNATLWTQDSDFEGIDGVKYFKA